MKERIKVILTTLAYKDLSKFPDQNILDQKNIDYVNQVNENGKKFIRTHFTEYMKNPKLFLLNSVKEAIKKVTEQAYH